MMKSAALFILLLSALALTLLAQSPLPQYPYSVSIGLDGSRKQQCSWYNGNRVTLSEKSKGKDDETTDTFEIYDDKNILITSTERSAGAEAKHQILLVDGYWMLARNATLPKDAEIDALDAPLLFLKLTLELLCRATSTLPGEIAQRTELNLKEKRHGIEIKSGAAGLDINTPWSLLGKIEPLDGGRRAFELDVDFKYLEEPEYIIVGGRRVALDQKKVKSRREEMLLSGTWQQDAKPPVLADDMSHEGWQIFSI